MKTTMRSSLFILSMIAMAIMISAGVKAQLAVNKDNYNTAIGIRAGATSGLTIKHFTGNRGSAFEGIIGLWPDAMSLTCLYEKHANAGAEGLNWYYGGGGHVFFESGKHYYRDYYYYRGYYNDHAAGMGLDGIIGLEYKIKPIPFAISLDLKPFFEVGSYGWTYFSLDPGLGFKLAF